MADRQNQPQNRIARAKRLKTLEQIGTQESFISEEKWMIAPPSLAQIDRSHDALVLDD